ncbi:unnamed protein product [Lymnaea stagnalis]|uniref:Uncharacterized protein n=1 Tax=Lymnaea stagnalis TaxID=6523 RepID=A0AAV2HWH1_LYMST
MVVNHSRCSAPRQAVMEGETVHFTSVLKATGVNLTIFWRYILFSEGDSIHDMTYYIGFIVLAKCDGKRGEDRPDRGMVAGACWMDGDNIRTYLEIKASTKYNASKVYMLWCGPGLYLKSARIAFPVVLQKEYMTLTVNSQDVSLREGVLPLKPNRSNYVILCTINMVRPHIRASFNGELFESPVDCLKHSISVTSAGIGLSYHVNVEERGGDCERTINSTLVVRKGNV